MINRKLAKLYGLSKDTIQKIEKIQKMKITENDFDLWMRMNRDLQKLWGFKREDRFIRFWEFKGCKCPKMDNDDRYPLGEYVYSMLCPIHKRDK